MMGGVYVDRIKMLERLVSIKSNAQGRASQESMEHPGSQYKMKAFILEKGIEQLIIEIQNTLLEENETAKLTLVFEGHISSQAS